MARVGKHYKKSVGRGSLRPMRGGDIEAGLDNDYVVINYSIAFYKGDVQDALKWSKGHSFTHVRDDDLPGMMLDALAEGIINGDIAESHIEDLGKSAP